MLYILMSRQMNGVTSLCSNVPLKTLYIIIAIVGRQSECEGKIWVQQRRQCHWFTLYNKKRNTSLSRDIPFLIQAYTPLCFRGSICIFSFIFYCVGSCVGRCACSCSLTGYLCSRLFFPVEWFEATVRVNPRRFL